MPTPTQNTSSTTTTAAPAALAAPRVTARNRRLPFNVPIDPSHFPDVSHKGAPQATVENLEYLLQRYGIPARYNIVSKRIEIQTGQNFTVDNEANCNLAFLSSLAARSGLPRQDLAAQVCMIADKNAYSPVRQWVLSKPWDNVSRLQKFLDTVTVEPGQTGLKDILIRRWLISAIAAAFSDSGFTAHGVLVFQGLQGVGKTSWFKSLVPADLDAILDGATLDPANKDHVLAAIAHWIVELGELDASFRKADIARIKAFLTQGVDKVRRPYDRAESEFQRRTVFCASVNEANYLADNTGNRRFWTVAVQHLDYNHGIDMQQLWAEVHALWAAGEQHWLTPAELDMLNNQNKEHETIDPVEEKLLAAFDFPGSDLPGIEPKFDKNMTSTAVLEALGYDQPTRAQVTHMSTLLKKHTGLTKAKKSGGLMVFPMPKRRIFKE